MTFLVTGATGGVGRVVVDLLLEAGAKVRATSRDPRTARLPEGVDVRAADLAKPETFVDVFSGVEKVFLFPEPSGVDGLLELAESSGVGRVVVLSSAAAGLPDPAGNPIALMHLAIERAVDRSGIEATFVRPAAFASNTLQWAPAIKAGGELRIPYAEATVSPVHEHDIAAVAARALLTDGHQGAIYEVTGPESLTQRRQAEILAAAIGRPITVTDLTGDEAHAEVAKQYAAYGVPGLVEAVVDTLTATVGQPSPVTTTVEGVTGAPARTFAEWAEEHKGLFDLA